MRRAYRDINFTAATLRVIEQAQVICADYARQGYSLTLRQLYYQFVARGLLPNLDRSYKRLGSIVNDARLAGLLDWRYIVDRTRQLRSLPHWGSPASDPGANVLTFVEAVMPQFRTSKWDSQPLRMEVWIEKDALVDVIARPANGLDLAYFACRGYNSQSNAHDAAQRVGGYYDEGAERVVILHLGDHDPSGIDMSRDIETRFREFLVGDGYEQADPSDGFDDDGRPRFEVRRLALNMDQVRQYNPPPNPAKMTDSRVGNYLARFGATSWELDALDPQLLDALIRGEVEKERDEELWQQAIDNEAEGTALLRDAAARWPEIVSLLRP